MQKILIYILINFFLICTVHAEVEKKDISDLELNERIDKIQLALDEGQLNAKLWWYGWLTLSSIGAIYGYSHGFFSDNYTTKVTNYTFATQAVVGVTSMLFTPLGRSYNAEKMRLMPSENREDKIKKLLYGESQLKKSAEYEIIGSSWVAHAASLVVSFGGALTVWKVYGNSIRAHGGNPEHAALCSFFTSLIFGEIQIFSQPTRAITDWKNYNEKYKTQKQSMFLYPYNGGIVVGLTASF